VAAGVRSIAIKAGPNWGNPDMKADVANVRAVRKAIGDDVELTVDTNGGYDYTSALDLGRRLEEFNLAKYEQPVPYWDIAGLRKLRENLRIPICAHESSTTLPGLLEVIKMDAADIVGLKVMWVGGITQAVKWGHIATTANMGVYCGANNGQYEAVAQAHWFASNAAYGKLAHANFGPCARHGTFDTSKLTNTDDIVLNPMKYKDGYFYPPDGPGLGLELNEKAVPKYITKGKSAITVGG
jgi:L-alanine-DL-glutamate epimerase-like enolase superfamily enzyme